jgi:hypothetical protein
VGVLLLLFLAKHQMYYLLEPNYLSLLCKIKPWFVREWGAQHHHHHHQHQQNAGNLREAKNEGWFFFSIQNFSMHELCYTQI